jgi:hypothetical protein
VAGFVEEVTGIQKSTAVDEQAPVVNTKPR